MLCRWEARHAVANGTSYAAQFYRFKESGSKMAVEPVTELNKKFQTEAMVRLDDRGKWVRGPKAKFTTVAEVKKLLKQMGMKQ